MRLRTALFSSMVGVGILTAAALPAGASALDLPEDGAVYTIRAQHSGKCLDVQADGLGDSVPVIEWTCHGGSNQQWRVQEDADKFMIQEVHSGRCLDVEGASLDDGAPLIQWSCHTSGGNEVWYLVYAGAGSFELQAAHSGKCADVQGGSSADGSRVIQYTCAGTDNQRWKFVRA
ncbi:RICIN domain-containing protein [Actinokineospora sp. NBRC 105648]|uniref:RICIN domain-containing protein n=1 Tax=Actinokineospora sp. NBRC 105648 TaxID=3032206 RepID=UPI0024A013AA|nr:RICIN domain-containing protein [Actinokineospora sp. NBRC 105648]GLZ36764.1 hypothetical protein Acsp05_03890 [Actinokineospora sp. NBRC 105648]